ncbi:MAG: dihydrolipoamide acetyltransferase family protein [Candidatus Binatia bacterium]
MTEGKLARWLIKEGEHIEKGQALAEIETDKAVVEIDAPGTGTLQKIIVSEDQTVAVGTLIGIIGEEDESLNQIDMAAPAVRPQTSPLPAEHVAPLTRGATEARLKASPLARKMAEEAGIDLTRIKGTGPGGRVVERDIEAAMTTTIRSSLSPNRIPLSRARQAIAKHMTESKTKIPHFYVSVAINMTQPLKLREELNHESLNSEKISINDQIIAAAAQTLVKFPRFNASYSEDGLEMHPQINVGIAVALEDGLITLVLREANKKSLKTIAIESKALSERARKNKLQAGDLGSGTFTVSNLGMFGVDEFSAIINPPEAAILAAGEVTQRPIVVEGAVRVAPMMNVTLSVDHRVVDGAQAGRFLQEFKKLLENPTSLLTKDSG